MREHAFQDELFSSARWIVREVRGATVRVRLAPLGAGRVRIERYERRRTGERDFARRPSEEGRVVALAAVDPDADYAALFGTD